MSILSKIAFLLFSVVLSIQSHPSYRPGESATQQPVINLILKEYNFVSSSPSDCKLSVNPTSIGQVKIKIRIKAGESPHYPFSTILVAACNYPVVKLKAEIPDDKIPGFTGGKYQLRGPPSAMS